MKKTKVAGNTATKPKDKKVKKEKKPTDKLADKTALTKFLQGVFGDAQKKILKRLWKRAQEINKLEPKYEKMSDKQKDFLDTVTNYNIEARYPEDKEALARTLTPQVCRQLIDETKHTMTWILEQLSAATKP